MLYNDGIPDIPSYMNLDGSTKGIGYNGGVNFGALNIGGSPYANFNPEQIGLLQQAGFGNLSQEQQLGLLQNNPQIFEQLSLGAGNPAQQQALINNGLNRAKAIQNNSLSNYQKGGLALQGVGLLANLYQGHQALKLAKNQFAETKALNRANFKNQAKQINTARRDLVSGRGYVGQSSGAQRALGNEYRKDRLKESY